MTPEEKPYTATVWTVLMDKLPDGSFGNPHRASNSISVQVYFERSSPGEAYQSYGVELKDPAFIMCEVSDAGYFAPDSEVEVGGRLYSVVGQPEIHDAGDDADHVDVTLEFKQFTYLGQQ